MVAGGLPFPLSRLLRRLRFVTPVLLAAVAAAPAAHAAAPAGAGPPATPSAQAFLPPAHQLFAGVAGQPVSGYLQAVGKHPAVYEEFVPWGQWLPGITADATALHARLMIHISTLYGSREAISPAQIAAGAGDAWLIGLGQVLADSGNVTYVRLMAEMDGYWNPYCAFNADGSRRGAAHSTQAYRQAWRRVTLILRGGSVAAIDTTLSRLGMPPLRTGASALATPRVAMLWVPQVAGAPDIPANSPRAYWPGRRWVDWIGTDFYANAPNFAGLTALYNAFPGLPFVFGELALWGTDDPGWVDRVFSWIGSHPRTRMVIYNQGVNPTGPFRLIHYPAAGRELRRLLGSPRFPAFAPGLAP